MTTILYVRHAEVHNPRDVVYARLPRFGLSARGRDQAIRVAECLADRPVAAVYTSPLLRARQTADVIAAGHGLRVRRAAALLEIGTSWAGTPNNEVPKGISFYVDRKHEDDETEHDVLARMQRFLRLLLRRHAGQTVVCVSHADPINVLTLWAGGLEVTAKLLLQPLAPARGAVMIYEYRPPYRDEPAYVACPVLSYLNPQDPEPEKPAAADSTDPAAAAEGADPATPGDTSSTAAASADAPATPPAAAEPAAAPALDGAANRRNGAVPGAPPAIAEPHG